MYTHPLSHDITHPYPYLMQVLTILGQLEAAPSTQIFTGQVGTSQIPDDMDVVDAAQPASKATLDSADDDHMMVVEWSDEVGGCLSV